MRDAGGATGSAQVKVLGGAGCSPPLQTFVFLFISLLCSFGKMGFSVSRAFCRAGVTDQLCEELGGTGSAQSFWDMLGAWSILVLREVSLGGTG